MYVGAADLIKEHIQGWAKDNRPELRIGWGGAAACPCWQVTRFALPNPQLLGEIEFTNFESLSWPPARYFDELKRAIEGLVVKRIEGWRDQ